MTQTPNLRFTSVGKVRIRYRVGAVQQFDNLWGGDELYRDRGFATSKPVTAEYFVNSQTMCLQTEYNGSVFEEELKLIGRSTEPGKRLSPLVSSR